MVQALIPKVKNPIVGFRKEKKVKKQYFFVGSNPSANKKEEKKKERKGVISTPLRGLGGVRNGRISITQIPRPFNGAILHAELSPGKGWGVGKRSLCRSQWPDYNGRTSWPYHYLPAIIHRVIVRLLPSLERTCGPFFSQDISIRSMLNNDDDYKLNCPHHWGSG